MTKKTFLAALSFIFGSLFIMSTTTQPANAQDSAKGVSIELSTGGTVVIDFLPELAPKHVERIKALTKQGFYDGLLFHRVLPGFMAQTGDPLGNGTGSSNYPDLPAEFSRYKYKRGTVGMARGLEADTANSQFFICFTDTGCRGLTGQYTVWGQVVSGMEYVDKLATGEPPRNPDRIVKMRLIEDDKKAGDESSGEHGEHGE